MKLPFLAPPVREELRSLKTHELVRDFPELLSHFSFGDERGGSGIACLSDDLASEERIEELVGVLSWREGAAS